MSGFSDGVTAPEGSETSEQETSEQSQTQDYLEEMVGEGKKYQTVEEAAKALAKKAVNADNFIETLKTEKQDLETRYNELQTRNKSIDEVIAAIREDTEKPPQSPQPNQQPAEEQNQLSLDDILAKFDERLNQREQEGQREQKIKKTWEMLSSENGFGDLEKAKVAVANYIGKDDSRKALVDSMAIADPQGLAILLKQERGEGTSFIEEYNEVTPPQGNKQTGRLTWDLARKVRKENPDLYYSKAFQNRMHQEL